MKYTVGNDNDTGPDDDCYVSWDTVEEDGITIARCDEPGDAQRIADMLNRLQWHPIDTAPKDGTPVLLYTQEGVIEGYWQQDRWEQYTIYCTYDGAGGPAFNAKPTYWMPLPEPPKNG